MPNKKILYVTTELYPYQEDSTMGKAVHEMALKMYADGNDVRVFMPRFGLISERKFQLHEVIRLSGMNIIINDLDQPLLIKVASLPGERLQVYFIDNEEYFKRKAVYQDAEGKFFDDNDERAIFFARGVIETIKKLNWVPDIIHLNGWMSAMIPIYLKTFYSGDSYFENSQLLFSVYDAEPIPVSEHFNQKIAFDKVDLPTLAQAKTSDDILSAGAGLTEQVFIAGSGSEEVKKALSKAGISPIEYKNPEDIFSVYNLA